MVRILFQNGCKYGFLPALSNLFGGDQLDHVTETEKKADLSVMQNETGWDRVRRMFHVDEFGNITNEANSILQVAAFSSFVGVIYGGTISSKRAYTEFMENNQATKFKDHFEAKKTLQDKVTLSFGKGAFKWGWRLTLFSTSFVGISTVIQAYRGKCGILEYVLGGAISGSMYKFNMGPRGWIVGGGVGSVLGLFCGTLTMGLLSLAGISMEEARFWQQHWKNYRKEYWRKGMADYLEKEDYAVIRLHDDEVGEVGKDISNLDKNVNNSKHDSVNKK